MRAYKCDVCGKYCEDCFEIKDDTFDVFGLTFKWSIATGIWLIICILRSVFNVTVKK